MSFLNKVRYAGAWREETRYSHETQTNTPGAYIVDNME